MLMVIRKNNLILYSYFLMMIIGLFVPSDVNHGIFSLISISFISATVLLGMYAWIRQNISIFQLRLVSFFLFSIAFLLCWLWISITRGHTSPIAQYDQFKLFLITLIFPLSTLYLIHAQLITSKQ